MLRLRIAMRPPNVIRMAITQAKMGRSMKNLGMENSYEPFANCSSIRANRSIRRGGNAVVSRMSVFVRHRGRLERNRLRRCAGPDFQHAGDDDLVAVGDRVWVIGGLDAASGSTVCCAIGTSTCTAS